VRETPVGIAKVVLSPQYASSMDPTQYRLVGTVEGLVNSPSHQYSAVPEGMEFSAQAGKLDGRDWVFENLTANKQFEKVAYIEHLNITWRLERVGNATEKLRANSSDNPAYLTFEAVKRNEADAKLNAPKDFKLLRSFVHIGSIAVIGDYDEGNPTSPTPTPLTKDGVTLAIWDEFKKLRISTFDGKPLVYYKTWGYKDASKDFANTTSAGILVSQDGDCTSFVRLFIDALRAQGIENSDDFFLIYADRNPAVNGEPNMFIKNWDAADKGTTFVNGYGWTNTSEEFWPWKNNNGTFQYAWSPAFSEVTKVAGAVGGQNNANPQAIFRAHIAVQLTVDGETKLYDPSYGKVYADINDFQDKAVAYYALRATGLRVGGKMYASVYVIQAKSNALQVSRSFDAALKDY